MMVSDDGRRLAFDKRELAVLTGMMAKEERVNLAALWFHGGRAQAWATDGHRAVIVERGTKPPGGDPNARPVAIPAATAHHIAKTAGARDVVVVDIGGPQVTIVLRERIAKTAEIEAFGDIEGRTRVKHSVTCKRHEGGYSTIDFAFPSCRGRGGVGAVVALDPGLLAPVVALASITGAFVWLNIGGEDDPILFLATGEDGAVWRVVVMPKRPGGLVPPDREPPPMPGGLKSKRAKRGSKAKPATPAAGELARPGEPTTAPTTAGAKPPESAAAATPAANRGRGASKLRAVS
jgi:hypothetical protein